MYQIQSISIENLEAAIEIWNQVVVDGLAFPQMETLTKDSGWTFFDSQSFTGVAIDSSSKEPVGLYILHPNNVGRCGHICNASYAVKKDHRGKGLGAPYSKPVKRPSAPSAGTKRTATVVA